MSQLAGSRTEQNLLKAFAGESQARMRYDYFARCPACQHDQAYFEIKETNY